MAVSIKRDAFEALVSTIGVRLGVEAGDGAAALVAIEEAAKAAKARDEAATERLCAVLASVAFATPEATPAVYDAFTRGWLGLSAMDMPTSPSQRQAVSLLHKQAPIPAQLWNSYWSICRDVGPAMSPTEITTRVAAMGGLLPSSFHERAEAVACSHPGVHGAAERSVPSRLSMETLAVLPQGSLGHDFYRLIIDHQFDLEVLDRDAAGLGSLPPALRYLNTRILQMHDVWHLVGGYTTSALHENAISAFQLAQFGHNYSAWYLATVAMATRVKYPAGLKVLWQVIAEGWQHSRKCPSFMDIAWEDEWHLPISEIRQRHAIPSYKGFYRADLIEWFGKRLQNPVFKAANWVVSSFRKNRELSII